ncbi:Tyrosine-protein phosphatase yvh1 [Psilocybe cubensis]|uniref:Tyrosine-protein phosphatase yvh1 n=2 Tax=Psilocybe cubensis TaxID=181762 RepID=A0ACB8GWW4_PSICU|nr:Tyrosine-protein phosphatase yvh1 [Psilocybe cubensis]KAH9479509.1 Tyrosine-protein phosphatase yvh1 [Psilocybe cubensis]
MLSFPAANWQKALGSTSALGKNLKYGRVASPIIPGRLYLSDLYTATDEEKIRELGITHIITVMEYKPALPDFIEEGKRMHIPIADSSQSDILQYLDATTNFIKRALEENEMNKVLVHCFQGISRSATVVCAYLVATTSMTAESSITHVQSLRGIVSPNDGFRRQLNQYGDQYVKLKAKPKPNQAITEDVLKFGGGIAARIRRLKGIDTAEKSP